jgi:hypothetical protein
MERRWGFIGSLQLCLAIPQRLAEQVFLQIRIVSFRPSDLIFGYGGHRVETGIHHQFQADNGRFPSFARAWEPEDKST